jgi:hypothetical protein
MSLLHVSSLNFYGDQPLCSCPQAIRLISVMTQVSPRPPGTCILRHQNSPSSPWDGRRETSTTADFLCLLTRSLRHDVSNERQLLSTTLPSTTSFLSPPTPRPPRGGGGGGLAPSLQIPHRPPVARDTPEFYLSPSCIRTVGNRSRATDV